MLMSPASTRQKISVGLFTLVARREVSHGLEEAQSEIFYRVDAGLINLLARLSLADQPSSEPSVLHIPRPKPLSALIHEPHSRATSRPHGLANW